MKHWIGRVVLVVALLAIASPASAFNGSRKGFLLGAGLGAGFNRYNQELTLNGIVFPKSDDESKGGFATDFRIGAGVNDQFTLYYVNDVNWFSLHNALDKDVTIANGLGLLGGSWYMKPDGPSFYFNGLIGLSSWATPFESGSKSGSGLGIGLGAGYEFAKHWSVEANLGFGSPKVEDGADELKTNVRSFSVRIHGLAY